MRRLALGIVLVLFVASCSDNASPPTSLPAVSTAAAVSTTTTNPQSATGEPTDPSAALYRLEMGDCWNDPGPVTSNEVFMVEDVVAVACDTPHDNEVFAKLIYQAGGTTEYPGDDVIANQAVAQCETEFEESVGVSFERSPLGITPLFPRRPLWELGAREVICSAHMVDFSKLIGAIVNVSALDSPYLGAASAESCEGLVDFLMPSIQSTISWAERASPDEIARLETSSPPELQATTKADHMTMLQATRIGCTLQQLDRLIALRAEDLKATNELGRLLIADIGQSGWYGRGG